MTMASPPAPCADHGAPVWTRRDTTLVGLLIGLALVRAVLFATVQWPWYAPDEPDHAELALLMGEHGSAVRRDDRDVGLRFAIAQSLYEWRVIERPPRDTDPLPGRWAGQIGRQPPLYYLLAGWAAGLVAGGDVVAQLYAMRLVSAVFGGLVVAGCYLAGRVLAPAEPALAPVLGGIALFQTMLGGLSGSANNDIAAVAAVTWALVAAIALVRAPLRVGRLALIGLGLVLALAAAVLSKRTALVAVPPAGLVVAVVVGRVIWQWIPVRPRWVRRGVMPLLGLVVLLGGLVAALMTDDDGGLIARPWLQPVVEQLVSRPYPRFMGALRILPDSWTATELQFQIWEPFSQSLWGRFGRVVEVNLPAWWYTVQTWLLLGSVVGLLGAMLRALWRRRLSGDDLLVAGLCGVTLLAAAVVALGPYLLRLYPIPPFGRYFLPALLPLALVQAVGWLGVWPRAARGVVAMVLLGLLAILDAYALFGVLIPHFAIRPAGIG